MSTSRPPDDVAPLAEHGQGFLHHARGLRGLTPQALARIARRLEAPGPRPQPRILVRALAVAALVLTVGTAVAWASGALERLPGLGARFGRAKAPPPAALPRASLEPAAVAADLHAPPEASGPVPHETTGETTNASPVPQLTGDARDAVARRPDRDQPSAPRGKPRRRAAIAASHSEAAPAEGSESRIVLEGRSFARALELWRARRDATAALAALDEHERRFAGGQMRAEALVLRAEILLTGGREREALAALDQVPLDEVPRGRELRILRGELRVRFGRCEQGRSDLGPVARGTDAHAARAREALLRCP